MLSVFNILIHEVYQKFDKSRMKMLKIWTFLQTFSLLGPSGVIQKSPEISTNTYRTKLNICELNFMGNTPKVKYKFVLGKFCKKKRLI